MKPAEDQTDSDYGRRVLAAYRVRGLSTSHWNYAAITAMEKATRLEFLALFKRHDRGASYALVELVRSASPEELVDRLVAEKELHDQLVALIPMMFTSVM
ncbi:MAG TPA: hypothetical protein VJU18_10375 [Vicinamibacteria bacterium]|nr:hypothetical protein [Vicinamibacteria bacterium]